MGHDIPIPADALSYEGYYEVVAWAHARGEREMARKRTEEGTDVE